MSEQDGNLLRELADTLAVHNIQQYNTLLKTKDGFADTRIWKELRRKDGARIYRERSIRNGLPTTPSLLLLGTLEGTVDEIMYGAMATTEKAIRIKSAYTQDGVINCKVLKELVHPTMDDPFHHVSVKWRLYNNQRDYVSLDATGIAHTVKRERVGYNISHSVAFAQIPALDKSDGIERGNMSVCSLYHQKSPTTVECYVRGFFDFHTQSEMVNAMALQNVATQWSSFTRNHECALMKRLVWRMRRSTSFPSSKLLANNRSPFIHGQKPTIPVCCELCSRNFGFLGTKHKTCDTCSRRVCSRCCSKHTVCVEALDQLSVLVKKGHFCCTCLTDASNTDALGVARDELASSEAYNEACIAKTEDVAQASIMLSAVQRRSQVSYHILVSRDNFTI